MTESNKVSRRDWFRLRQCSTNEDTAKDAGRSMGQEPHSLQPIAHPENHDGMDLSSLPPMREALLSQDQVRQVFSDIENLASGILLMQRSVRSQRATMSGVSSAEQLRTAQDALLSGTIPRVQIRYHWQEVDWIDTLERRDDGVRLVRICHVAAAPAKQVSKDIPG